MVKRSKNSNSRSETMKKKVTQPGKKGNSSTNPDRAIPKIEEKQEFYRSKGKIKLLNLYNEKKPNLY